MRAFAKKSEASEQATSARSTMPRRAQSEQSREVDSILRLQRTIGNQAVQRMLETNKEQGPTRRPGIAVGHGGLNLHGRTDGVFDGGKKSIPDLNISQATGCDCPAKQPCMIATGTLVVKYNVNVTITMPPMPSGLSECKQNRVRAFFKNVLLPHEEEHKRRFETYNTTTRRPIKEKGCGQSGAKSAFDAEARRMHAEEAAEREKAARDKSAAIDPFFEMADFDGCK